MSVFVLDASVAAGWLLDEKAGAQAEPALMRLQSGEALVPHLWHLEMRNCLLVAMRRGQLAGGGPAGRLNALYDLPIRTDPDPDLDTAFALAEKHELSFYDAIYLELAKRHTAPIATLDKALSRAAIDQGLPLVCDLSTP